MKSVLITLALALVIGFSTAAIYASSGHQHGEHAKQPPEKAVSAVCPVMKSKIADVKKAAGKSVYKGKTYYFCCKGCKPKFDKEPEKYIGKNTLQPKVLSAVCPVMGSKIPDVKKAAGKSVYKGKAYYFCCAGCKPKFDENPEKFLNKNAAPKK